MSKFQYSMKLNVGRSNIYLDQTKQKKKKEKNTQAISDMLLKKKTPPSDYQYHYKLQAHMNRHTEKNIHIHRHY